MTSSGDLFGTVFERGETVFRQGEPGEVMFLVQSGAVEIATGEGSGRRVLAVLGPGEVFGEMALLDRRPRSATATAARRSRLVAFTRESLLRRLRRDPDVALHLLRVFSARIQSSNRLPPPLEADRREDEGAPDAGAGTPAAAYFPAEGDNRGLAAGEVLFRQGDGADALFVVLEGSVDLFEESSGAGRYRIATLGPGELLGEMALISDLPRSATAVAASAARLLVVGKENFRERIAARPELGLALLHTLSGRLRAALAGGAKAGASPEAAARPALPVKADGRVRIGSVTLTGCAGCTGVLLEEPAQLAQTLGRASIEHSTLLMDRESLGTVDVCLVEGCVRLRRDIERLREARSRCRVLVAWGTCAAWGGIPALANRHEVEELLEAAYGGTDDLYSHYLSGRRDGGGRALREAMPGLLRYAGRADEHVLVDLYVPGCPPGASHLAALLREIEGAADGARPAPNVCAECPRKPLATAAPAAFTIAPRRLPGPTACLLVSGTLCLGAAIRGGCGGACTRDGQPCWGCRGPSDVVGRMIERGETLERAVLEILSRRARVGSERLAPALREARSRAGVLPSFAPAHFARAERHR